MESSSSDNFLWGDTSNDSKMSTDSDAQENEQETTFDTNYKKQSNNCFENKSIKDKKVKKRKGSERCNSLQSEKKQIKLEPESDIELRKKDKAIKVRKHIPKMDEVSHVSDLDYERILQEKVKQEQATFIEPVTLISKKKKKKRSYLSDSERQSDGDLPNNEMDSYLDISVKEEQSSFKAESRVKKKKRHKHSNSDNGSISSAALDLNREEMENYLYMKVKQESTLAGCDILKSKKKKNRRSSGSNLDDASESKSAEQLNGRNMENFPEFEEQTGYILVKEKFSAEETVINNPKKRKRQRDNFDNSSTHDSKRISLLSDHYREDLINNDLSIQQNDFSCNNIASSTVLNVSPKDNIENEKLHNTTHNILKCHNQSRTINISDRIRFEDDESSSQDSNLNKTSSKVKAFLQAHPHLQIAPKTQINFTISNDELWILRCPNEISHQKLKNTNLLVEGKCKIKIDGQTYTGVSNEGLNRITLLTYQHGQASLSNMSVKSCINYHKSIPKAHIPENIYMVNNQTNFIPLPDTKCRHPLFGANYKKSIKIPAVVTERLEAAKISHKNTLSVSMIKKKHKKKKSLKMEVDCELQSAPIKISRKRKHSQDTDMGPPKKTKHKKHNSNSVEIWESEKAIEENLFNF